MKNYVWLPSQPTDLGLPKVVATRALLVISFFCLLSVKSIAQTLFFREYAPTTTDATNNGRCIIRPAAGNDKFLSVGSYYEPNQPVSGHGIWTNNDGTPNGATIYNRTPVYDYADYNLNFIEDNMVQGSYTATPPYQYYTGHPAVGVKIDTDPESSQYLLGKTWTTIIDPTNHDRKWDHILTNENYDFSKGVSVVREIRNNKDFFVLSQLENAVYSNQIRFAVTKYKWIGGNIGHVVDWSNEYNLSGYNLTAVGIVQVGDGDNNLVVVGNATLTSGGSTRIFSCEINRIDGSLPGTAYIYRVYTTPPPVPPPFPPQIPWDGDVIANSVTGPFNNDHFLIAGRATTDNGAIQYPMLLSIDYVLASIQLVIYDFCAAYTGFNTNGGFNCAKEYTQEITYGYSHFGLEPRVYAVGWVGDRYGNSTDALFMYADNMRPTTPPGSGYPVSERRHRTVFTDEDSAITVARWLVDAPDTTTGTDDKIRYTGDQTGLINGITHAIQGAWQLGPASECEEGLDQLEIVYPYHTPVIQTFTYQSWGEDVSDPTYKDTPELSPLKCTDGTISAGKRTLFDEPKTSKSSIIRNTTTIVIDGDALNIVHSSSDGANIKFVVVDLMGNILVNQHEQPTIGTHYYTIDTKEWVTGPYFVSVVGANLNVSKKIVIIR